MEIPTENLVEGQSYMIKSKFWKINSKCETDCIFYGRFVNNCGWTADTEFVEKYISQEYMKYCKIYYKNFCDSRQGYGEVEIQMSFEDYTKNLILEVCGCSGENGLSGISIFDNMDYAVSKISKAKNSIFHKQFHACPNEGYEFYELPEIGFKNAAAAD